MKNIYILTLHKGDIYEGGPQYNLLASFSKEYIEKLALQFTEEINSFKKEHEFYLECAEIAYDMEYYAYDINLNPIEIRDKYCVSTFYEIAEEKSEEIVKKVFCTLHRDLIGDNIKYIDNDLNRWNNRYYYYKVEEVRFNE